MLLYVLVINTFFSSNLQSLTTLLSSWKKGMEKCLQKRFKTLNHVEIVEKNPSTEPSPRLLLVYIRLEMTSKGFNQF